MFIEPHFGHPSRHPAPSGWIEVICGSMFSGKTEELIRRLRRAQIARQRVEIFKPSLDKRYDDTDIVSHSALTIRSTPISMPGDMHLLAGGCDVVGIDEAQFFDESLVEVCTQLADGGTRVIIAGLDMDYGGRPFGPMPALMATAEFVTKVHAICARCGAVASYSYRLSAEREQVLLGEKQHYEPRCRACFRKGQSAGHPSPGSSVQNTPPPSL